MPPSPVGTAGPNPREPHAIRSSQPPAPSSRTTTPTKISRCMPDAAWMASPSVVAPPSSQIVTGPPGSSSWSGSSSGMSPLASLMIALKVSNGAAPVFETSTNAGIRPPAGRTGLRSARARPGRWSRRGRRTRQAQRTRWRSSRSLQTRRPPAVRSSDQRSRTRRSRPRQRSVRGSRASSSSAEYGPAQSRTRLRRAALTRSSSVLPTPTSASAARDASRASPSE